VVLEVTPKPQEEIIRRAKNLRRETGIVVTLYLTTHGRELRKERISMFMRLKEQGLAPKWHKGARIRYKKDGQDFEYQF
jgi:hypothetical protein